MKTLFGFIPVVLISFFFVTSASSQITLNGYEWQRYTRSEKISFVQGWMKCGKAAEDDLPVDFTKFLTNPNEIKADLDRVDKSYTDAGIRIVGVTVGQVVDAIDSIYQYIATKNMDVTDVMPFVAGKLRYGWTTSQLEEAISVTVKLNRCEQTYKANDKYVTECAPERRQRNTTMEKLNSR